MNKAVVDYFFVELNLGAHFEALRHFLLMEDGEFAQSLSDLLFEKVSLGGPGARVAALGLEQGGGQEAADSLSHGYFGAAWGSVDCQPQPSNQSRPGRESTWPRLPAQPPPPLSCTWGQAQLRPAPPLSQAGEQRESPLSLEIKVHSWSWIPTPQIIYFHIKKSLKNKTCSQNILSLLPDLPFSSQTSS